MTYTLPITSYPEPRSEFARLLFPGGVDMLKNRDAAGLKRHFDLADGLPSLEFAEAVWDALIELGQSLPEDDRPGPMRPWQGAAVRLFIQNSHASLQGARQGAGKTFVAALVIACHLLLGSSVSVAMPTYRQGTSILIRRVRLFMQLLAGPCGLKRTVCNVDETQWDNGARLSVLSTSPGGRRGTQGWTCRVMVIDESQDLKWDDLAWFMPLVALAMKQKRGRLLMLGVGAGDLAAPAMARHHPGYASLVLDDATISELDRMRRRQLPPGHPELMEDSWADFFAAERGLWDEDKYRQFYMCQAPGSGQRKVFDRVPEMVVTEAFPSGRGEVYPAASVEDKWMGLGTLTGAAPALPVVQQ
ncbi:MAG TPA: DEAD/DEAH box helicase family protein, partial [Myxococcota bacterium]|nr:DEAD/DEAH box helicase family protein [Myxococcota bacterium]